MCTSKLPEAFAAKATDLLLGRSATNVTDEGATDVTGELCNMFAGASPRTSPLPATPAF